MDPKDTKTFFRSKRYENLFWIQKIYENLSDPKDTKTFWIQKIPMMFPATSTSLADASSVFGPLFGVISMMDRRLKLISIICLSAVSVRGGTSTQQKEVQNGNGQDAGWTWTMAMAASLSSTATAVAASSSCHHRLVLTRRFHHDHYLLSPIIAAHHNNSLSQYYYYSAGINHHLGRKSSGSAIIRLASSSQLPVNTMKLPPLAYPPFMVVAALSSVPFSSQARAFVTQPSYYLSCRTTPKIIPSTQNKRCVSLSSSSSPAKELSVSAAAYDESTTTTTTPSNTDAMIVQGEILSYYSASSSSNTNYGSLGSSTLVVVKICEEDLIPPITKLSAAGLGAGVDGSVPMATTTSGTTTVQRSPVGLEKSLFSKSGSSTAVTKDNTKKRIIGKFLCILFFSSFLHCHYFWNQIIILPLLPT